MICTAIDKMATMSPIPARYVDDKHNELYKINVNNNKSTSGVKT